jgi:LysM repeat protein
MKPKLLHCLALVLGVFTGCAANKPTSQPAFSDGHGIYIVQPGDSGAAIAKKLCLSMQQLSDLNPNVTWSHLKIGQELKYVGLTKPPHPVFYHNAKYDFTFSLPASWAGYSVVTDEWDAAFFPTADSSQKSTGTESGPIIVLRNPLWRTNDLYQDIPIMVFTHKQWTEEHDGKFFPYAGGVLYEMWHNSKYVFGLYSRYNADDSVKGWKEAGDIITTNCAAHPEPHLHDE